MNNIVREVREFVREECEKPSSNYGYRPFESHFKPVVKYGQELAEELDADKEIVTIAAWLHDIGSIIEGRKNHHISGAKIAEEKLKELNYPDEKIDKVKECILNHRGSREEDNNRELVEAQIVAEADALSAFDSLSDLFEAAYIHENIEKSEEARRSVIEKLENKWNQLSLEESRKIIKPKYDAVRLLLK